MEFFDDIFDILDYSPEEKERASADLAILVRNKMVGDLSDRLSKDAVQEIEDIPDLESPERQEKITAVLTKTFSQDELDEAEGKATGDILYSYLEYTFADANEDVQARLKDVLVRYGVEVE